jgi:hypothetical protein
MNARGVAERPKPISSLFVASYSLLVMPRLLAHSLGGRCCASWGLRLICSVKHAPLRDEAGSDGGEESNDQDEAQFSGDEGDGGIAGSARAAHRS